MKICAIICEFNPFHNGHRYIIGQAKQRSGCDGVLCLMSGSFTQRGDLCIIDKYNRARHAILGGADAVLGLPAAFTVAPAEIFAKGAVKILSAIPDVTSLAFGCEDSSVDFIGSAKKILSESGRFSDILHKNLAKGESYIKSYEAAFIAVGGDKNLLKGSNNILALEYTKAILRVRPDISIVPIKRVGCGHGDTSAAGPYMSSGSIRENILNPAVKKSVPDFVFGDLRDFSKEKSLFERLMEFKLLQTTPAELKKIYGCTEGLENKLKKCEGLPLDEIINIATGKRYTSSRIRRILLANLLGLYAADCENYLNGKLYLKPLAVKKDGDILPSVAKSDFPLITSQTDMQKLSDTALECLKTDINAYKIACFIRGNKVTDFDYPVFI